MSVSAVLAFPCAWAIADLPTATELLDHDQLSALALGESTVLEDFPLADAGRFALDVTRFSVLAPGGQVVEMTDQGEVPIGDTGLVLLKGTIVGQDEDSLVFIAVGQWGINGFVSLRDEFFSITTGPYAGLLGPEHEVVVTSNLDLTATSNDFCAYDDEDPKLNQFADDAKGIDELPMFDARDARGTGCNLATIAVDTDYEFTSSLFGGNTNASSDYAMTLLGATSTIYERDVNTSISVGFLRVWSTNTDPYSGGLSDFLDQVRAEWLANMGHISRVVVHGLSGRNLGGGVAYLNVLCSNNLGYGVSGSLNGSFPNPPQDHSNANWDIIVVPHELGHNFGSAHTHDYNPPIDGCGNGDCSSAWGGTIMSYCHLCSGGLRNIVLQFHSRVQDVITARVNAASCITTTGSDLVVVDDNAATIQSAPVNIDVLANDAGASCGVPELVSVQSPTPNGGTAVIVPSSPFDLVQYTPAPSFVGTDIFTYTINDGQTGTVTVDVSALRNPDNPANPQPGVAVDYYLLDSPTMLPDFSTLTPLNSDVVPNIDYPATSGIFATGWLANNLGAVFEGYVDVDFPGLYTFEVESD
ncbi:MAG: hypothetical protein D6695_07955, partial [Planctomycetota bacterium]